MTRGTLLVDCNSMGESPPANLNSTSEEELKGILVGHEAFQKLHTVFGLD